MIINALYLLLILLGLYGCGSIEDRATSKEQGIAYLNEGKFKEALGIFQRLTQESPGDDEAKFLTASAHAGIAHASLLDKGDFLRSIIKNMDSPMKEGSPLDEHIGNSRPDVEKLMLRFTSESHMILNSLFSLRHTPEEERVHIISSIAIADEIKPESKYYLKATGLKVFVNMFGFVNYLRDGLSSTVSVKELTFRDFICGIQPVKFERSLFKGTTHLLDGIDAYASFSDIYKKPIPERALYMRDSGAKIKSFLETNRTSISTGNTLFSQVQYGYCF